MAILTLRAQNGGYRGCVIEEGHYLFFQLSRKNQVKRLGRYPQQEFCDPPHFLAIMLKNILPTRVYLPPAPISALSRSELDRVYAIPVTLDPTPE